MPTTTNPRFLQIHTLHSYPAALLNRDDSGLAKRMRFGGDVRTRISSQCLKRHWRKAEEDDFAIHNIPGAEKAIRSRNVIGRKVMQSLRDSGDASKEVLDAVEVKFVKGIYGPRAVPGEEPAQQKTRQPLLLGLPEVEYLRQKAAEICATHPEDKKAAEAAADDMFKKQGGNFKAFRDSTKLRGGLEGALFGRMVTSDPGANIDAAVHVAHAFTVHREESESDYFSVVDDLQRDDEDAGAAHIGDMELTAGLFYGYVVVDARALVSNLSGYPADKWMDAPDADRELAGKVVEHLAHLIATVSPGAKLGSTAPYACADLMLIEAGSRQPRSLANAYRGAVRAQVSAAGDALSEYLGKVDAAYGANETRRFMAIEDCELPAAERVCLDDLAAWAADAIRGGKAEA